MSHKTINLNINGTDFEAVVEYSPAVFEASVTNALPENCHEAESEDIIISSLHVCINVCGIKTRQDVWFLVDELRADILEQLADD